MTLNLAAIFDTDPGDMVVVAPMIPPTAPAADPGFEADPIVAPIINPWPIVDGVQHFSIWADDPGGPLTEFIPGFHFDIRQRSRLRPLCSPRNKYEEQQQ